MLLKKTLLAATMAVAFASGSAMADAWTVTQATSIGGNSTVKQNGTTSASVQGLNVINSTTADITGAPAQTVTAANDLTLNQEGGTLNSVQAGNYMDVGTIGTGSTAVSQTTTGTGDINLNQNDDTAAVGINNKQAANYAKAETITNLSQSAIAATIALDQDAAANGNTQAVNYATGTTAVTKATQAIAPTTALTMDQNGTGANTQAGNMVEAAVAISGLNQTAGAGSSATALTQAGGTGVKKQAINMALAATTGAITTTGTGQAVTGATTLSQAADTTAKSHQAGNYASVVAGSNNITQSFGTGSDALGLTQLAAANVLQAGNAIISPDAGGGTANQTVTGTLTMAQTGATAGSFQAGNYLGNDI